MSDLWSPFVSELHPYVPGEQLRGANVVKLNTNENPFPPSSRVLEALKQCADERLRLYPDPESLALRRVIADYHSIDGCELGIENVFVGNGSDEVLAHAFNAFFRRNAPVLYPDISYSFYPVYCELYGIEGKTVALDEGYCVDIGGYCDQPGKIAGAVIANPNAPTGTLLPVAELQRLATANRNAVVIVEEAYIDFADNERSASAISLLAGNPNVLVTRTLSKSRALAGLRLGYALGSPDLIEALSRVKNSFNSYPVDTLAQAAAIASIEDEDYFQQQRQAVIKLRNRLAAELQALGFTCLPSASNFIMATHGTKEAAALAGQLREKNILVRYFSAKRLDNYLRISVGSAGQNAALVEALKALL